MIAFDTNHLLRHVLQDDPKQCAHVASLMESAEAADQKIHILDFVLMEACWVLQSSMGFDREGWSHILDNLLQDPIFSFDDSSRLWKTLERYRDGKAMMEHGKNISESGPMETHFVKFMEHFTINKIDVYGTASDELKEFVKPFNLPFYFHPDFAKFSRN